MIPSAKAVTSVTPNGHEKQDLFILKTLLPDTQAS
jgi:hypothetical protein